MAKINEMKTKVEQLIASAFDLHSSLKDAGGKHGLTVEDITGELALMFAATVEELKKSPPPPNHAPSHDERALAVSTALNYVEKDLVIFGIKLGVENGTIERHFEKVKPILQGIVVLCGMLCLPILSRIVSLFY
jgi:hypothetical protein